MSIVLYGIGSSLLVDYEESCIRRGLAVAGAVKNVAGPVYTSPAVAVFSADDIPENLLALPFIVPIFTPGRRRFAVEDAERRRFSHSLTLVDPTAIIAGATTLGDGTFVNCGAVVGGAGRIGKFVLINRSASIGHHAEIGDYASIGPGAVLAGHVRLGRGAVVGVGAHIAPDVMIGDNAVVSAGAVVTRHISANTLVGGHPARIIRSDIVGYNDLSA